MQTTGIEVLVRGVKRFSGKVSSCPFHPSLANWVGHPIFYRSVPYERVYFAQSESIAVDCAAWDKARELGAKAMVLYCPAGVGDSCLIAIKASAIARSEKHGSGDSLQYRVSIRECAVFTDVPEMKLPYTAHTVSATAYRDEVAEVVKAEGKAEVIPSNPFEKPAARKKVLKVHAQARVVQGNPFAERVSCEIVNTVAQCEICDGEIKGLNLTAASAHYWWDLMIKEHSHGQKVVVKHVKDWGKDRFWVLKAQALERTRSW